MSNKMLINENSIQITCPRGDTETVSSLRAIYPVHKNRIDTEFVVSGRMIPEALKALRGIDESNIDTAPPRIQELYNLELRRRTVLQDLRINGPKGNPVVNSRLTLRTHQQLGREIAEVFNRFCFFFDTRTGKTPLALTIINDDIKRNPKHKWLIVCPLILIQNAWIEDCNKFFPDIKIINCHASTKAKRLEAMQCRGNIYVTNTESFATYKQYYIDMGFDGAFLDESSSMKKHNSQQTEALVEFSQQCKHWYLLSGTPATNGEFEYFAQIRSVDYYAMPQSYNQFKQYYFINLSFNPKYDKLALRPDRIDEFNTLLSKYALYVDKEDVLTTPGRTFHEVEFKLPDCLKEPYKLMKTELYADVSDEVTVIAPSAAAKLNKLNQITSGFIMDTEAAKENKKFGTNKPTVHLLSNYRFELLYEWLDKLGDEQIIVWCNYKKEFEIIKERLGNKCRCIYGDVSLSDKNEAIRLFKSGQVQYLIANPASADKGLTLTNSHINIYFSLNWSYETFKQSYERIYGDISSQPKHCDYYIFIAKGTIDGILYRDVLQGKQDASYAVLNHLKAGEI